MNLIEHLKGKLFLHVDVQPEGTYFCKSLEDEDLCKLDKILGTFQSLDSTRFADLQYMVEQELLLFPNDNVETLKEMLNRYAEACKIMEEEETADHV